MEGMKIILSLLLLTNCVLLPGQGGEEGASGADGEEQALPTVEATEIKSFWGRCINAVDLSSSTYQVLSIGTHSVDISKIFYTGVNCQNANKTYREQNVYSYTNASNTLTLELINKMWIPLSASQVSTFNTATSCGRGDWDEEEPVDITGTACTTEDAGDTFTLVVERENSTLKATFEAEDEITYAFLSALDFDYYDRELPNGSYVFYQANNSAMYLIVNSGTYEAYYYKVDTLEYFSEQGSITYVDEKFTLTPSAYAPGACFDDIGEAKTFNQYYNSGLAAFNFTSSSFIIMGEKVSYSRTIFEDEYLGAGWSYTCF